MVMNRLCVNLAHTIRTLGTISKKIHFLLNFTFNGKLSILAHTIRTPGTISEKLHFFAQLHIQYKVEHFCSYRTQKALGMHRLCLNLTVCRHIVVDLYMHPIWAIEVSNYHVFFSNYLRLFFFWNPIFCALCVQIIIKTFFRRYHTLKFSKIIFSPKV